MKIKKLAFKTSCDKDFIERLAKEDPFNYFNNYIAPETGKLEIPKNFEIEVEIEPVSGKFPYNYFLTYTLPTHFIDKRSLDNFVTALFAFHGWSNFLYSV